VYSNATTQTSLLDYRWLIATGGPGRAPRQVPAGPCLVARCVWHGGMGASAHTL